jgi:hypothetical protein
VRRATGPVGIDRRVPTGKTGGMAGRERWGLRGNVHMCRLERKCFMRRCGADACETQRWGDSCTLEFRDNANFAWHSHHNPTGSEWISTYEYDDTGKLLTESCEYSATGCKKKTHYVNLAAHSRNTNRSWSIEGTDAAYSAPGAVTLSPYYNERGSPGRCTFSTRRAVK